MTLAGLRIARAAKLVTSNQLEFDLYLAHPFSSVLQGGAGQLFVEGKNSNRWRTALMQRSQKQDPVIQSFQMTYTV